MCAGAEPRDEEKGRGWFALNEGRPLFVFAGIWTEFKGDRGAKSKPIPVLTRSPDDDAERDC
jgi:putative SOS response-associated peptidase YedK